MPSLGVLSLSSSDTVEKYESAVSEILPRGEGGKVEPACEVWALIGGVRALVDEAGEPAE